MFKVYLMTLYYFALQTYFLKFQETSSQLIHGATKIYIDKNTKYFYMFQGQICRILFPLLDTSVTPSICMKQPGLFCCGVAYISHILQILKKAATIFLTVSLKTPLQQEFQYLEIVIDVLIVLQT